MPINRAMQSQLLFVVELAVTFGMIISIARVEDTRIV